MIRGALANATPSVNWHDGPLFTVYIYVIKALPIPYQYYLLGWDPNEDKTGHNFEFTAFEIYPAAGALSMTLSLYSSPERFVRLPPMLNSVQNLASGATRLEVYTDDPLLIDEY